MTIEHLRGIPFPVLKNDLVLRAARGEDVEKIPVWVMRQAGRETRSKTPFFTVCRTPELVSKVTLQPIERYGALLDAAIIFSDILVVPQALGMQVEMLPEKGPHFPSPLTLDSISTLKHPVDVSKELGYVLDGITLTRHDLLGRVPLFGFCGGPWTLLAYMIEGGGSKTYSKAKTWLFKHQTESHEVLQILAETCINFLAAQAKAGAQLLQVFESNSGELPKHLFMEFCFPYIKLIVDGVKKLVNVPVVIFCRNTHFAYSELNSLSYDVIGIDYCAPPSIRSLIDCSVQGNADPCLLYADDDVIRKQTKEMLLAWGSKGYIANLGHGMLPDHEPEKLRVFLETIRDVSVELCKKGE